MRRLTLGNLPTGSVCHMATWFYRGSHISEPHCHTFYELFWVESGKGHHIINGETRVMSPGYLALIRPEDVHSFSGGGEEGVVCFHNFAFLPDVWRRIRERFFPSQTVFFSQPDFHQREVMLDEGGVMRLRVLAGDLQAGFHDRLSAEAFLTALLCLLRNRRLRLEKARAIPVWLLHACEQIRLHAHFKEGISAFIRLAGRSPEHVAREARKHFGKTPRDFVNEARLEHVAAQLCASSQPILDIIFEAGFENVGHFYQLFRQRFGRPPLQYRLHYAPIVEAS